MDRIIVILAGGVSSRMKASQHVSGELSASLLEDVRTKPKAMLPVGDGGRPFLDYLLKNVSEAGYTDVIIVTNQNDSSIYEYYQNKMIANSSTLLLDGRISSVARTPRPERERGRGEGADRQGFIGKDAEHDSDKGDGAERESGRSEGVDRQGFIGEDAEHDSDRRDGAEQESDTGEGSDRENVFEIDKAIRRLHLSFVTQTIPSGRTKPLGTADALLQALRTSSQLKGRKCTVCNSDNLYSVETLRMLLHDGHTHAMPDYDRSVLRFEMERILQFAVIKKDKDGYLLDILEKPPQEELEKLRDNSGRIGVSMNLFRFTCDMVEPFLEQLPLHPVRQEKSLPEAVRLMIQHQPKSMWTFPVAEHVLDLTSPADIFVVTHALKTD